MAWSTLYSLLFHTFIRPKIGGWCFLWWGCAEMTEEYLFYEETFWILFVLELWCLKLRL